MGVTFTSTHVLYDGGYVPLHMYYTMGVTYTSTRVLYHGGYMYLYMCIIPWGYMYLYMCIIHDSTQSDS